jgi:nitroreductase
VVLVKNKDTRSKLRTAGYSQSQFTDSALLLVFCVKKEISDKDIEKHVRLTAKARNQSVEELEGYKQMLLGYINNKSQDELSIWASKQAYIALGFAIFAAASMEIDTCPMEGFDNSRFDEVLSLHDKNLKSVVSLAVGYRSQDDKAAANAKVRLHESEMFIRS